MIALVYGIVRSASAGWTDAVTITAFAGGVLLLIAFVLIEERMLQPVMPLRLFSSRERIGAYCARMFFLGAMMGFWFFTTQFLQGVLGFHPSQAGLAFLPTTLPNFAAALVVPKLARRYGNGPVLAAGVTMALLGMVWLSRVSPDTSYLAGVALPMVLIGMGQGFSLAPLTVAGVAGVAAKDAGAASGVVSVAHQLGSSLGLGVLIVVAAAFDTVGLDTREMLARHVSASLTAGALMLAFALALVLVLIVRPGKVAA